MKIQRVADCPRLFSIHDICPSECIQEINQIDWWSVPRDADMVNRWQLQEHYEVQEYVNQTIRSSAEIINESIGDQYCIDRIYIDWLICGPGYVSIPHTDGSKPNTMILYWKSPNVDYGTTFYNTPDCDTVLHYFPAIPNTGFLAIYDENPHRNWHGTTVPVTDNDYRLITAVMIQR